MRVVLAVDPGAGVSPAELAVSWDADEQARSIGVAAVEAAPSGAYLPGLLELVIIPVAVNLASGVLYDVVKRLVQRSRREPAGVSEVEIAESTTERGDRVVVIRLRRSDT